LAAPLAPPHGTLLCHYTLVGNHWSTKITKAKYCSRLFLFMVIQGSPVVSIDTITPKAFYLYSNFSNKPSVLTQSFCLAFFRKKFLMGKLQNDVILCVVFLWLDFNTLSSDQPFQCIKKTNSFQKSCGDDTLDCKNIYNNNIIFFLECTSFFISHYDFTT